MACPSPFSSYFFWFSLITPGSSRFQEVFSLLEGRAHYGIEVMALEICNIDESWKPIKYAFKIHYMCEARAHRSWEISDSVYYSDNNGFLSYISVLSDH